MQQNSATGRLLSHHGEWDLLSSYSEKGSGQWSLPHKSKCLFPYAIYDIVLVDSRLKTKLTKSQPQAYVSKQAPESIRNSASTYP